jgi:hypothetical protein
MRAASTSAPRYPEPADARDIRLRGYDPRAEDRRAEARDRRAHRDLRFEIRAHR